MRQKYHSSSIEVLRYRNIFQSSLTQVFASFLKKYPVDNSVSLSMHIKVRVVFTKTLYIEISKGSRSLSLVSSSAVPLSSYSSSGYSSTLNKNFSPSFFSTLLLRCLFSRDLDVQPYAKPSGFLLFTDSPNSST